MSTEDHTYEIQELNEKLSDVEGDLSRAGEEIQKLERMRQRAINELHSDDPDEALRVLEGKWS